MKKIKIIGCLVAAIAVLLSPLAAVGAVEGEELKPLHPGISNGRSDTTNSSFAKISLKPGEHFTDSFKFLNLGSENFQVNLSTTPYSVSDEEYTADQTTETARTQISRWISFPRNNFVLEAGAETDIEYVVDVPKDVPDGGQYAIIVASADLVTKHDSWVNAIALGYTIYATVNEGNTRIAAELVDQVIPGFYLNRPIGDKAAVKNTGNTDVQTKHQVIVRDYFSDKQLYDSGKIDNFILPETTRNLRIDWGESSELGIYKMTSIVELLGQTYQKEGTVIIIPLYVIIIFCAMIILLIWATILKVRQRKRRGTQ